MSEIRICLCHAPEDDVFRERWHLQLTILRRQGLLIADWNTANISAGSETSREIAQNLQAADLILLLISDAFLGNNVFYEQQIRPAIQRHVDGKAQVIPVLWRKVGWKNDPSLGILQPLPADGSFLASWPDRDEAFCTVGEYMRTAVEKLAEKRQQNNGKSLQGTLPGTSGGGNENDQTLIRQSRPEERETQILPNTTSANGKDRTQTMPQGREETRPYVIGGNGSAGLNRSLQPYIKPGVPILAKKEGEYIRESTQIDHKGPISCLLFTPDGRTLISDGWDHHIKYWDAYTRVNRNHITYPDNLILHSIALNSTNSWLGGGGSDQLIRFWNFQQGQPIYIPLKKHQGPVACLAFTSDGTRLVSGGDDSTLILWNLATGKTEQIWQEHSGPISSLAFSPNGKLLASGSHDTTIKLWDGQSRSLFTLSDIHQAAVLSVAFHPKKRLLVSGNRDHLIKVWDLDKKQVINTLVGHNGPVSCLAFSPNGRTLISGSYDQTVRVWDYRTGETRFICTGHTKEVLCLAFHPKENRFASGGYDRQVYTWNGLPDSVAQAAELTILAQQHLAVAEYEDAEQLYLDVLAIREKLLGMDDLETASSSHDLAELYRTWGKYAAAGSYYLRALDVREKLAGLAHPDTAATLNGLADLYNAQGKYEDAKPLYERALAIRRLYPGAPQPETALTLNSLGGLYQDQGSLYQDKQMRDKAYTDAYKLYEEARQICEQTVGPDHPYTALVLHELARLYQAHARFYQAPASHQQAEELYQRALKIYQYTLGDRHPKVGHTLHALAVLYHDQKQYPQANALYNEALDINKATEGNDHPSTANTLVSIARLHEELKREREAETCYRQAIRIHKQVLVNSHPQAQFARECFSGLLRSQGRIAEAISVETDI